MNHAKGLTSRIQAEAGGTARENSAHYDLEYKASDWSLSMKAASSGVYTMGYLQSVTPWLSLGSEFIYIGNSRVSGMTLAGRFKNENNTLGVQVVPISGMVDMNYLYRPSKNVTFGTEFTCQLQTMDSQMTAGYCYMFQDKSANVTAQINSEGLVTAVLTRQIMPTFALMLSAELDHKTDNHKFGVGITLET